MAGVRFKVTRSAIATGTSLKTLMQIVAAANHGVVLDSLSISFDGVSNTATPILVQIARQTTAGTMSALTPAADPVATETLQVTAQHTATVEPTTTTVLQSWYVHPQTGIDYQFPFAKPIKIDGGTRLGILVTAGASVSAAVNGAGEE